MAVASAGPYASLHPASDRQPCQYPTTQFLQAGCPFCRPTNSVKALKALTYKHNIIVSNRIQQHATSLSDTGTHICQLSQACTVWKQGLGWLTSQLSTLAYPSLCSKWIQISPKHRHFLSRTLFQTLNLANYSTFNWVMLNVTNAINLVQCCKLRHSMSTSICHKHHAVCLWWLKLNTHLAGSFPGQPE